MGIFKKLHVIYFIVGLFLLMGQAHPVQAQDSAKHLAQRFKIEANIALGQNVPDAADRAHNAVQLLDRILAEFPKSIEARLLKARGRLPNDITDLKALRLLAQTRTATRNSNSGTTQLAMNQTDPSQGNTEATSAGGQNTTGESLGLVSNSISNLVLPPPVKDSNNLSIFLPHKNTDTSQGISQGIAIQPEPGQNGTVFRKLRRASVLVYFVEKSITGHSIPKHIGSGSYISNNLVLTNAHVVDAMSNKPGVWLVINETTGLRRAKVVAHAVNHTPIKIDAAVLRIDGAPSPYWLKFARDVQLDQKVMISGYPGDATRLDKRYRNLDAHLASGQIPHLSQLPTALLNDGRVNNFIAQVGSNATELQYTMVTAGGNSGSPVADFCGDIVGLHYNGGARLAKIKYNGGVHLRDVMLFLKYANVPVQQTAAPCRK